MRGGAKCVSQFDVISNQSRERVSWDDGEDEAEMEDPTQRIGVWGALGK
jgi:hypothetical protein